MTGKTTDWPIAGWRRAGSISGLTAAYLLFAALPAGGQEPAYPLEPPDRSSPRAAIRTFLDAGDALGLFLARDYIPSPSHVEFRRVVVLGEHLMQGLDLSQVPPAAHAKIGRASAIALYETLCRIQLPPLEEIPAADRPAGLADTNATHWVIPHTEIALSKVQSGPRRGEFLFSVETVAKADRFYERVCKLAYTRPMPLEGLHETVVRGGGWLIPNRWIQASPAWLQKPLAGQAVWKWIAMALTLGAMVRLLISAYRLSRRGSAEHPLLRAVAQVVFPSILLLATAAVTYLALVQINMRDRAGSTIELVTTAVMYIAGAWISWRGSLVVAETIISSPRIARESIDAHLIRICTRLLGIAAGASLLAMGADQLGVPVYGIVAGLGVGGLAIALAAQPTIENLIGGLSLYADKPVRVGDACRCGSDEGTVESIGLRSTRIRSLDRTLTTIPNAELSKMAIANLAERDRMLIQSVIGVRYETSPDQLRYLLARIRECLAAHPRVHHESARARLVGFGPSSLDIEVFAYVTTRDKAEFLGVREDVWLRVMDIVEQSGTGFAFPSQTLYVGRDRGPDANRTKAAEEQVRQWREEGRASCVADLGNQGVGCEPGRSASNL